MFTKIKGIFKPDAPLKHLNWFKVGGPAQILFKPHDTEDLVNFLVQNNNRLPIMVLGAGSNIIIRDGGLRGVVIKLGQSFTNIEASENTISVGGGCLNFNLAQFCLANSISGFEFLTGIPGTIGGGIFMNAGAYGHEFKDIIVAAEAVDSLGNTIIFLRDAIKFYYRSTDLPKNLIITKGIFKKTLGDREIIKNQMLEINRQRNATQPIKERTSGSTFINPPDHKAWQLIDQAGLRGYKIGDASMSEMHCNFMINHGNATAKDLEELGDYVRDKVFTHTGIMLEWEIKRIGDKL